MAHFIPLESQLKRSGVRFVAGIDEAGRGPLAGPVVSAAVILKDGAVLPGLDDSKKLSAQKREKLFELIMKNCVDYAIAIVSHITIDEINILNAVRLANKLCVEHLRQKPEMILIDGKDRQTLSLPHQTIIKGDSKVRCIAAASILAKVTRDKIMHRYAKEYKKYGFENHVGYGTREHKTNIFKFGLCPIHRKSYNCTQMPLF